MLADSEAKRTLDAEERLIAQLMRALFNRQIIKSGRGCSKNRQVIIMRTCQAKSVTVHFGRNKIFEVIFFLAVFGHMRVRCQNLSFQFLAVEEKYMPFLVLRKLAIIMLFQ